MINYPQRIERRFRIDSGTVADTAALPGDEALKLPTPWPTMTTSATPSPPGGS
jgi:hypothetical protein